MSYEQVLEIYPWRLREENQQKPSPSENEWEKLQAVVKNCTACSLYQTRTQTVFGSGNVKAALMVIGEAPGFNEDKEGQPFVGRAGLLLNEMLKAIGLARDEIYIANILKCRPPNNRDPTGQEAALCTGYLNQQIEFVQPQLLLAVGKIAAHYLLKTKASIESLRLKTYHYGAYAAKLVVTYHPAYLLRNPIEKRKALVDLKLVQQILQGSDKNEILSGVVFSSQKEH